MRSDHSRSKLIRTSFTVLDTSTMEKRRKKCRFTSTSSPSSSYASTHLPAWRSMAVFTLRATRFSPSLRSIKTLTRTGAPGGYDLEHPRQPPALILFGSAFR